MKIFGVNVSQRDPFNHWSGSEWIRYSFEITLKSAYTLVVPLALSVLVSFLWHRYVYGHHLYFDGDQDIILTGVLLVAGLVWGLFATIAFGVALNQFYEARRIIRQQDLEKLIERYDEKLPPLMHVLIFFFASLMMTPLMLLNYKHASTGYFSVGGVSFVLLLAFFVLREIDKPFSGTWTLNNIPAEWLVLNLYEERIKRIQLRAEKTQRIETPDGTVTHHESLTVTAPTVTNKDLKH